MMKTPYYNKSYRNQIAYEHDLTIYQLLKETNLCPKLIAHHDMTLILEYLDAPTVYDHLTTTNDPSIIDKCLAWISAFNQHAKNIVLNDLHLRNMLYLDQQIYGIDFEDLSYGDPKANYGIFLAYLLSYDHLDEHIQTYAKYLLHSYQDDPLILAAYQQQAHLIKDRRLLKPLIKDTCLIIANTITNQQQALFAFKLFDDQLLEQDNDPNKKYILYLRHYDQNISLTTLFNFLKNIDLSTINNLDDQLYFLPTSRFNEIKKANL
ncbi:MAG: phosphotransferase [Erysipelotrichaceae bacterium]|nr:phosphotransferase [Erysipelotrichaceae bacterium]MDY5251149.1 phosphotransferase [Erysipelotrichaceae bacterium]